MMGKGEGKKGPRGQGTKGSRDRGTKGPREQGNEGLGGQGTKGPRDEGTERRSDRGEGVSRGEHRRDACATQKAEVGEAKGAWRWAGRNTTA